MVDNGYTIKEASKILDCSTQNIYRQKNALIKLGYMIQNNTGSFYITDKGINYLREKRIDTMRQVSQDLTSDVDNNLQVSNQAIANPTNAISTDYIELLKEQIQELKIEKDYWKQEYEKKDDELKSKNEYIQGINTKVFALLGTEEDNKRQAEETTKKSFWHRLFK